MAASMTLSASEVSGSVNIANNTSDIEVKLTITTTGTSYNEDGDTKGSITINGTTYSLNGKKFGHNDTYTIFEDTITIPHATDGSKTVAISYSFNTQISAGIVTGSKNLPLTKIARASSISCTAAKIGNTATISITRASKDYTHTLRYVFGDLSGDIATTSNKVDTSASFTIPTTFYNKIPNAKSGTGTIYCKTYNGTTQIGDETNCSFTVTVDEATNKPTIVPTIQDKNNTTLYATGSRNVFVKGYSNASYTIGAEAKNGASIDSILITCGDLKGTTDSGVLNGVQSGTFNITVKDSRGFTVTQTIEKELVNYIPLTCVMDVSEISANGDVTITFRGNCYKGKFGSGASLTNENYTHIMYKYKEEGGEYGSWSQIDFIPSDDNTYSETAQIHGLNHQKSYTFYAQVCDAIEVNWINLPEVTRNSIPIFDWGKNDFNFNVPLYYQNEPMDFVIEQGTDDIWTYRKWYSGIAECWGRVGSKSYDITSTYGTLYYALSNTISLPSGLFETVTCATSNRCGGTTANGLVTINVSTISTTGLKYFIYDGKSETLDIDVALSVKGTWE